MGEDAAVAERQRDDDHVQPAVAQQRIQVGRDVLFHLQRHLRRNFLQRGDQVRQQIGPDAVDDADAQGRGELVPALRRDLADALRFFQHALRLLHDGRADRRERDLVLAALEYLQAQLIFQLLYRQRQRRLADERLLRRAAEVAFLRHGDDEA